MAGWVYILSNPAMQNLLKIGYTDRDPFGRAKEISQATGVPFDFVVDYQIYVSHPYEVEQKTHRQLSKYRVNNNREFFQCSYEDAIYAIKEVISLYEKENDEFVCSSELFHKLEKEKILYELDKKRRRLIKQKEIQRNQLLAEAEKKFKNDKFYLENSKKIKVQEIHKNHKESFFRRFVVNLAHLVTIIIAIALIAFTFWGFTIGEGQPGVVSLLFTVYLLYEFYKSDKSNFSLGFRIDKMFDAYLHQKLEQLDNDYKTQFDKLNVDYQNTIHQIQENTK
ncbi:GIY-YIG nuclease family protein [Avibacterium avium]|uniref:GIY-YIG nuclease family protein n=1 Tax=Avibacterium avium TaxID=751 RepID=UPI003BF89B3E